MPSGMASVSGSPVHPRARGEHEFGLNVEKLKVGSSPRSRGTWRGYGTGLSRRRFIPALAGNIVTLFVRRRFGTVHPRARGEHAKMKGWTPSKGGSSPRSRGT